MKKTMQDICAKPCFETYVRLIAADMPREQAKVVAGYSPNSSTTTLERNHPSEMAAVSELRRRLQALPGFTVVDQVAFYKKVRDAENADLTARISSAKQMDKVLGYEAPREMEFNHTADLAQALMVLQTRLPDPAETLRKLEAQEVEYEDIPQESGPESLL